MNIKHIFIILLLVSSSLIVTGATTSSSTINYLSKASGDRRYCLLDGSNCALGGTGTGKAGSGYLYNDTEFMYLNETPLNATIDHRAGTPSVNDVWVNESGDNMTGA